LIHRIPSTLCLERSTLCLERSTLCLERSTLCLERSTLCLERSILCLERSTLCLERSILCLERSTLCLERSIFGLERSIFGLERSIFGLERSTRVVRQRQIGCLRRDRGLVVRTAGSTFEDWTCGTTPGSGRASRSRRCTRTRPLTDWLGADQCSLTFHQPD